MLSVNELALDIFEELFEYAEEFNAVPYELDNGARIVDCGVSTPGGYRQGGSLLRSAWADSAR